MDELNRDDALGREYDDLDESGSGDASTVATDLSPRAGRAPRRGRKPPWAVLALVAIVVALLVVVFNGLGDATLFFRNADEAVAQRDSLGDRRFRIQGRVARDSIVPVDGGVDFVISHGGVDVAVAMRGDVPDLFQETIPVVLEGRWARVDDADVVAPAEEVPTEDGWFFSSDRFFVKHEETYVEEHPDRTDDYDDHDDDVTEGDEGSGEGAPTP